MAGPIRVHVLGDSLTVGISDVGTNRPLQPWPRVLTQMLGAAGVDTQIVTERAVVGVTSREIFQTQVQDLQLAAGDIVCLWVGSNDIMRAAYTLEQSDEWLGAIFRSVEDAGAVPLTMQIPPPSRCLPGPARMHRGRDAHAAMVNDFVAERSMALGGCHVLWPPHPGMTGIDGTHLSDRGHHFFAAAYADWLCERFNLPTASWRLPHAQVLTAADRWAWYLRHGTAWLVRRTLAHRARRSTMS